MAHETPTLDATPRKRLGTHDARRLRSDGRLPAVIYGHKAETVPVSVNEKEILTCLKHGAHVVNLSLDGGATETCLIKELQYGFLGDNIVHVDFNRVNLQEEVEVSVHLKFTGQPEAAKKPGSILAHPMTELEITCKVSDIPDEIKVDISKMEEVFTVGEIELPPGVRTDIHPEQIVAQVTFVKEEEVVAEAAEVSAEAAEPEVITEKKEEAPEEEGEKKEKE